MRRGWFGHSHEHALAARGMRLYARKNAMQPLFYAQRAEMNAPMHDVREDIARGMTFDELCRKYPNADHELLRKRGREAIDSLNGNNVMSEMSSPENGVDRISSMDEGSKERVKRVLSDRQMRSFIPAPKVMMLERRL